MSRFIHTLRCIAGIAVVASCASRQPAATNTSSTNTTTTSTTTAAQVPVDLDASLLNDPASLVGIIGQPEMRNDGGIGLIGQPEPRGDGSTQGIRPTNW